MHWKLFVFTICMIGHQGKQEKEQLYIGGLIQQLKTLDLNCHNISIHLAIEFINNDPAILKDYEVVAFVDASGGLLTGISYLSFFNMISKNVSLQFLLAPPTTTATRGIGYLTSKYKLPMISHAGLAQVFDVGEGKDDIDYFVKVIPSPLSYQKTLLRFLQYFNWQRIVILYQFNHVDYLEEATSLSNYLCANGIEIVTMLGISNKVIDSSEELNIIEASDVKVIVVVVDLQGVRNIFCEAYKRKMFGSKYQWIITREQLENWWTDSRKYKNYYAESNNCSERQYLEASDGYIRFGISAERRDEKLTASNKTGNEIWELIKERKRELWKHWDLAHSPTPPPKHFNVLSLYTFDAVYMAALALDRIVKKYGRNGLLDGTRNATKAEKFTEEMLRSNFQGTTGHVVFNRSWEDERLGEVLVQQHRRTFDNGKYILSMRNIAYYQVETDAFVLIRNTTEIFKNGEVPKDRTLIKRIPQSFSSAVVSIAWSLTSAGLILAVCFIFFNLRYRTTRLIKMSSPNINNGILTGCILCYVSVILYGLDSRMVSQSSIAIACNAVTLTLSVGFTLSFGCLFAKTWRIYRIFTAAKSLERIAIRDVHLLAIITFLIAVDLTMFVVWMLVSPFKVDEIEMNMERYDTHIEIFFFTKCTCDYQLRFTMVTYGYKGLLLMFGLFLAWETRNVTVPVLNDSKFIGMSVYSVCVVSAVGVTCASALYSNQNFTTSYLVVSLSIFLCTTSTLLFIFVPKMYMLFGKTINIIHGNVLSSRSQNSLCSIKQSLDKNIIEKKHSNATMKEYIREESRSRHSRASTEKRKKTMKPDLV